MHLLSQLILSVCVASGLEQSANDGPLGTRILRGAAEEPNYRKSFWESAGGALESVWGVWEAWKKAMEKTPEEEEACKRYYVHGYC